MFQSEFIMIVLVVFFFFVMSILWLLHLIFMGSEHNVAVMHPLKLLGALFIPLLVAWRAIRKKKLDLFGATFAYFIGFTTFTTSTSIFCSLMAFFYTSNVFTKWKKERKMRQLADYSESGCRDSFQVLANGIVVYIACLLLVYDCSMQLRQLNFLAQYNCSLYYLVAISAICCSCGDTWASEIGTAIGSETPRLITTFRAVPAGTNGAVSISGLIGSALGGLFIGTVAFISLGTDFWDYQTGADLILFGTLAGVLGSAVDSVLGAVFQYSGMDQRDMKVTNEPTACSVHISGYPILSNNSVNLLASILTSAVIMPKIALALRLFEA